MCSQQFTIVSRKDPDVRIIPSLTGQRGQEEVGGGGVCFFFFFFGLFWSWREAAVDSSCWEFGVECALEYPSWRKRRGLLGAVTSRRAPGNASHSSSWQQLGHFQQAGEKHSRIIFWSFWEQRVEGAKGLRLKTHGGLRVSLALAPLLPCCILFLKSQDRLKPPPNTPIYSFKELLSILKSFCLCKLLSEVKAFGEYLKSLSVSS